MTTAAGPERPAAVVCQGGRTFAAATAAEPESGGTVRARHDEGGGIAYDAPAPGELYRL
ncbi:hypothetical protein [Streptomyces sp. NBRC 110028]|uniref:hypothetical protein n=1 Tax=Streptomyces sp. NBRC 110028 TaxID=1621260 RepID=UPI000AD32E24|nr:hypothetical protein [Streptomyces sp. NBRC 110028]